MKIAVTGASSGVGRAVIDAVVAAGHEPIPLGRHPSTLGESARKYDVERPISADLLSGTSAVIHLAWSWGEDQSTNVRAGDSLAAAAADEGARMVLLSTFSTFSAATSAYGAAKLQVESAARSTGGSSLRSGLIWGGDQLSGMLATLSRLARLPAFSPRLLPDPLMYLTDRTPLAQELVAAAVDDRLPSTLLAASPDPVRLSTVMNELRRGRGRIVIPAPIAAVQVFSRAATALRIPLPFRPDSLASLEARPPKGIPFDWVGDHHNTAEFLAWARSLAR